MEPLFPPRKHSSVFATTSNLLAPLDGLEQGPEVALAEATGAAALDQLEEGGSRPPIAMDGREGPHEDLQEGFTRAFRVCQNTESPHPLQVAQPTEAGEPIGQPIVVAGRGRQEPVRSQPLHRAIHTVDTQGDVLHTGPAVVLAELPHLGTPKVRTKRLVESELHAGLRTFHDTGVHARARLVVHARAVIPRVEPEPPELPETHHGLEPGDSTRHGGEVTGEVVVATEARGLRLLPVVLNEPEHHPSNGRRDIELVAVIHLDHVRHQTGTPRCQDLRRRQDVSHPEGDHGDAIGVGGQEVGRRGAVGIRLQAADLAAPGAVGQDGFVSGLPRLRRQGVEPQVLEEAGMQVGVATGEADVIDPEDTEIAFHVVP